MIILTLRVHKSKVIFKGG